MALANCMMEGKELQLDAIQLDEIETTILKVDDSLADVQDPLREVNLGNEGEHKTTFIS